MVKLPPVPFCAALLVFPAIAAAAAQAQSVSFTLLDTATLAAPRLDESSGVAPSKRRGVYWTHNDSGDGPYIYATDTTGRDLGAVRVTGARNVDWEDMARAPCPGSQGLCLFMGDIGDNHSRRPFVQVYIVPEPDPPTGPADTTRQVMPLDSIKLRYPDGPHNAESLVITHDGRLLVITKDLTSPAAVFSAPLTGHGTAPVILTPVCTLDIRISAAKGRIATGATLSPDGRWLVVRTYVSLHVFALDAACTPLLPSRGAPIPVVETQGEGITFEDAHHLVLTGERGHSGHAILSRVRIDGLPGR